VVRQRSAKPRTAVQFRHAPPHNKRIYMSQTLLLVLQSVVSIFLIIVILLQQKGVGLGGAFGGEGNVYRSRRGAEKFLFTLTIILGTIFLVLAVIAAFFVR
jgi:preprotein translocase subunit SecG